MAEPKITLAALDFDDAPLLATLAKQEARLNAWQDRIRAKMATLQYAFQIPQMKGLEKEELRIKEWANRVRAEMARIEHPQKAVMAAIGGGAFGGGGLPDFSGGIGRHSGGFRDLARSVHTVDSALAIAGVHAGAFTSAVRGTLIGVEHLTFAVRGLGLTLRSALISTGIGAAIVGIGLAIEKMVEHWAGAKEAAKKYAEQVKEAATHTTELENATAALGRDAALSRAGRGGFAEERTVAVQIRNERAVVEEEIEKQRIATNAKLGLLDINSPERRAMVDAFLAWERARWEKFYEFRKNKEGELAQYKADRAKEEADKDYERSVANYEAKKEFALRSVEILRAKAAAQHREERQQIEERERMRADFEQKSARTVLAGFAGLQNSLIRQDNGITFGARPISSFNRSLLTSGAAVSESGTLKSIEAKSAQQVKTLQEIRELLRTADRLN